MSRGNRQGEICRDDTDRERFFETLTEVCARTGWIIHAYVLMNNHYHILLETPEPNLVVGMKWFQGTYTQRFNARNKEWGHLFQGRYKALLVDNGSDAYFPIVSSYIHLNPVRAGLFDLKSGSLSEYAWSSYPLYLRASKRPVWLCAERVLNCHSVEDTRKGRVWYRQYIKQRVDEIAGSKDSYMLDPNWSRIRHGWYLGCDAFRDNLLDRLDGLRLKRKRSSFSGPEIQMHNERGALRLLSAGLKQLGLTSKKLKSLPKGAHEKKALLWYIRSKTTVSNGWLSEHIFCGHPNNIPRCINDVKGKKSKILNRLVKNLLECED
jgi:REP element-mobilizing transposase RayT